MLVPLMFAALLATQAAAAQLPPPASSKAKAALVEGMLVPDQPAESSSPAAGQEQTPPGPDTSAAAASANQPAQVTATADEERWYSLHKGRKFGLELDAGFPDGTALNVLFRPYWWLRLNAGMAYNVLGVGIRGGLTLMPVRWAATPSLSFDLGHYFSGDLNNFTTASSPSEKALLSDAAYDFWSLQIGFEFGSQEGFVFYLRGGIAHIGATLPGKDLTAYVNSTSSATSRWGDGNFSALLPCISLGFNYFIF